MTFLKELILIKQVLESSAIFVTVGIFQIKGFKFQPYVSNGFDDVLMMFVNLNKIDILKY